MAKMVKPIEPKVSLKTTQQFYVVAGLLIEALKKCPGMVCDVNVYTWGEPYLSISVYDEKTHTEWQAYKVKERLYDDWVKQGEPEVIEAPEIIEAS